MMHNDTAAIFNATIAASALAAAFEVGLLEELQQHGHVQIDAYCAAHDLHRASVGAVLSALHGCRIVNLDAAQAVVHPGDLFAQAYVDKGYFSWLTGGYGRMLQNLGSVIRNEHRHGNFAQRDGRRIAWAGRDYGARFVDAHFARMLEEMPFTVGADIGCGSGDRLIRLSQERPDFRGVGIELNPDAAELARQSVRTAGVEDRIQILHCDIQHLEATPECAAVETMFSFFMGHDLWPREDCLRALNRLRIVFPNARRFLLCDTYRSGALANRDIPIFTLGFELTHAVMGHYVPTMDEWLGLFAESDWTCVDRRAVDIPFSCIFDLR